MVDAGGLAAWVQAIGALLAIGAAWYIASRQDRAHDAREKHQIEARIAATEAVLLACAEAVSRAYNKMRRRGMPFAAGNIGATEQDLDACIERLSRVPIFDIPDADLVRRVVDAQYWMLTARRRAALVREQLDADEKPEADFGQPLRKLREYAKGQVADS